VLCCIIT